MALVMAPERSGTTDEQRLVRCDCGQVLAIESKGGDIKPVVIGWAWDKDGRAFVHCPDCGRRKRLPLRRVA